MIPKVAIPKPGPNLSGRMLSIFGDVQGSGGVTLALRLLTIWILAVAMALPFVWMVSTSLKLPADIFTRHLVLWPDPHTLENYLRAWNYVPFGRFLLNSTFVATTVMVSQLLTACLAGYAFARLRFPGRDILFAIYLGTMMIPNHVTLVPSYLIMRNFGMIDSYYALILPFMAHPFGAFLMRQFFSTVPLALEDAARMDGCSRLGILFRIFLPISKPAMTTLALFVFLFSWNDFIWPLIMTNSLRMRTLQVGLSYFQSEMGVDWTALMAATTISTIPILVLFLVGQRYFVQGLASAGLKY